MTTLYVFPDTNLFIQCHPLDQLNWASLGAYDEILLVVCRTVQREIDRNKNRGSDRVGSRARTANSLFRRVLLNPTGTEVVSEGSPKVSIELGARSKPSQELAEVLDYDHGDDEILGYTHAYAKEHPERDVILLTHDTGVILSGRTVGVDVVPIEEDWRLEPENSHAERELARVQQELEALKRQEPSFECGFTNADGDSIEGAELRSSSYQPLTSGELASAMDELRDSFPMVTDFEPPSVDALSQIVTRAEINPAGFQERVERYQAKEYPEWLGKCEKILGNLHQALQRQDGWPVIAFTATNEGSRPGRDVLVEVQARGNLLIRPPLPERLQSAEDDDEEVALRLPKPPEAPRRQFVSDALRGIGALVSDFGFRLPPTALMGEASEKRRDPNAFYYKPNRPYQPTNYVGLECEQWRHGTEAEDFTVELSWEPGASEVRGSLECSIHAENLSSPVKRTLPIRIAIDEVSTGGHVDTLIQELRESTADK